MHSSESKPPTLNAIAISDADMLTLAGAGKEVGEDVTGTIWGGMAFAALWGASIEEADFHPEFRHGRFNASGQLVEFLDVPTLARRGDQSLSKRPQNTPHLHFYAVPDACKQPILSAARYFEVPPLRTISVAISTRLQLLAAQEKRQEFYGILPDGRNLVIQHLETAETSVS